MKRIATVTLAGNPRAEFCVVKALIWRKWQPRRCVSDNVGLSSGEATDRAPSAAATSAQEIAGTLPSDPKVVVPTLPDIDPAAIAASEKDGGMRAVRDEVKRVMANPEINGNPIALNFTSKGTTSGYNRKFASNYDDIFKKKNQQK